jgi:hypothetical protein
LELLDRTKLMIVLSPSESQGIALCEAWMKDVPTLVWNRGYWQMDDRIWYDEKISSPYLVDQCGYFFKNFDDFKEKYSYCLANMNTFKPRDHAISHFSSKVVVQNFLNLIG